MTRDLTSGRLLARNTALNFVGQVAPLAAAMVTIPLLIRGLGTDRFALLTLAWMVIGYFSLFDMGLSRALTQVVADRLGGNRHEDLPALVWTTLGLMSGLGVVGGVVMAALSGWLAGHAFHIPDPLRGEALHTFLLLAFATPWVVSTGGFRGVLEAYQRFDLVNAMRVPLGVYAYVAPMAVLPFTRSLPVVVAVLVAGRILTWAAHLAMCLRAVPELRRGYVFTPAIVRPLLRMGGWMTVSNVISPLMTYFDRFVLAALLPVAAVAYYVTPYELATRLWLIPAAVTGVVFPALATSHALDRNRASALADLGIRATTFVVFPAVLLLSAYAPEGILLWLGPDFARASAPVLRWMAAGVFFNCVGQVAVAAVQGAGRPDLSAKLHAVEFPLYLGALWWLILHMGVTGAAVAWTLRVLVDTVALLVMADRSIAADTRVAPRAMAMMGLGGAALGAATLLPAGVPKAAYVLGTLAALAGLAWQHGMQAPERARVLRFLRGLRRAPA